LIVQGTIPELTQIKRHLEIIDRDKGIADILVRGKPRVIRLIHIRAQTAAAVIRDTFAGQVTNGAPVANQQQQQQQQQKQQQQLIQQLQAQVKQGGNQAQGARPAAGLRNRGTPNQPQSPNGQPPGVQPPNQPAGDARDRPSTSPSRARSAGGQESRTSEPTMTVAVDDTTNSIIVRAPDPLFDEVLELVNLIDKNATQSTHIMRVQGVNSSDLEGLLKGVLKGSSNSQPASKPAAQPKPQPQPRPQPQPTLQIQSLQPFQPADVQFQFRR
jgi:type II secretory pathway component GspD/PulD (secretin)